jgi:UDP-2,3-diacylglucosamine pyrophosphatase LpxH
LGQYLARDDVNGAFILGDLTDAKDRHPATLVDRIVLSFQGLSKHGKSIYILKGNHDYIDPSCPFFRFLSGFDFIEFITNPKVLNHVLFLPHGLPWLSKPAWKSKFPLDGDEEGSWDLICCHETFTGCTASNGQQLDGIPLSQVSSKVTGGTQVISGDIHVPQTIGNVIYTGSPDRPLALAYARL